jgi:hypothetical protein
MITGGVSEPLDFLETELQAGFVQVVVNLWACKETEVHLLRPSASLQLGKALINSECLLGIPTDAGVGKLVIEFRYKANSTT